jgi:hypothetical protein
MKLRIKNTDLTIKIISWLQIVGGITGIGLMVYLMVQTGAINGAMMFIFLFGLALFCYSIYAGKTLLTETNKLKGIILAIINQCLQVVHFSLFGYGLSYSSGAEVALGFQDGTFKVSASAITSSFKMALHTDDPSFVKINVFAILIIIVLLDIEKELQSEDEVPAQEEVQVQVKDVM